MFCLLFHSLYSSDRTQANVKKQVGPSAACSYTKPFQYEYTLTRILEAIPYEPSIPPQMELAKGYAITWLFWLVKKSKQMDEFGHETKKLLHFAGSS